MAWVIYTIAHDLLNEKVEEKKCFSAQVTVN